MDKIDDLGKCPLCGTTLMRMYGYGWTWDSAVCPARRCDYERELDVSTGYDPDGTMFQMKKPKEEQ